MLSIIYIVISLIVCSLIFYKTCKKECVSVSLFAFFVSVMFSCLIGLILFLSISSGISPTEISRKDGSCPIYSLNSQDVVRGNFCLGTGYINTQEYYRTFLKTSRGSYERFEVSVNNAEIFLSDSEPPKLSWQDIVYAYPRWFIFWSITQETRSKYDLTVPSNTIIQKFELK